MEFILVLAIFPVLAFIFGIIGQLLIKKIYIVTGVTFLGWLIATFTIFNSSFLMWVFIYTLLTFLGASLVKFIEKKINRA